MKTAMSLILGLFITTHSAIACMMAPQQIIWKSPKGANYQYSVHVNGTVTITSAKDRTKVLWKAKLSTHSQSFDRIHVVDGGKRIVSIKGNHRVNKSSDCAVETIHQDGTATMIAASEFIKTLQAVKERHTMSPAFKWVIKVGKMDAKGIQVINALNESKSVNWKS